MGWRAVPGQQWVVTDAHYYYYCYCLAPPHAMVHGNGPQWSMAATAIIATRLRLDDDQTNRIIFLHFVCLSLNRIDLTVKNLLLQYWTNTNNNKNQWP